MTEAKTRLAFLKKLILVFLQYNYGLGSHLGHVTYTLIINFRSPIPWRLHMEFGFDWSRDLKKTAFDKSCRVTALLDCI